MGVNHAGRRRGKDRSGDLAMAGIVLIGLAIFAGRDSTSKTFPLIGIGIALIGFDFVPAILRCRAREGRFLQLDLLQIDAMSGREFEYFVERLLREQGFETTVTPSSGDLGVDIVAKRADKRIAVQCKRAANGVNRKAVSDAVAGIAHYQCDQAMVVTNSFFQEGALKLAKSNGCELVDRARLADWVNSCQRAAA